jgi:hypothetical protein
MSPKTLNALPKSPAKSPAGGGGRRSSSGTGLRPVLPFDLDDPEVGSAVEDEDEAPEMGPMPIERQTPFAEQESGSVDEVEVRFYVFITRSFRLTLGFFYSICMANDHSSALYNNLEAIKSILTN